MADASEQIQYVKDLNLDNFADIVIWQGNLCLANLDDNHMHDSQRHRQSDFKRCSFSFFRLNIYGSLEIINNVFLAA